MSTDNQNLLLLFQRPLEPSFFPKDDGNTSIKLPKSHHTERYKNISTRLQERFAAKATNTVNAIDITLPDLRFTEKIEYTATLSLFLPLHREIAGRLINLFTSQPNAKALFSVAAYTRDRVNPYLFQYAYGVALKHRPETATMATPTIIHQFPDLFVDPKIFPRVEEEGNLAEDVRSPIDIPMNFTATDREEEQRLAYFREDIGVNMHHWHWHLVYPADGDDAIVRKDRRGELFYYMHGQCIARYNVERFCNKLAKVKIMNNFREPIPEAYFPKMIRTLSQRSYPPRLANSTLKDFNRDDFGGANFDISDLERWRDRILEAIDNGFVLDEKNNRVTLTPAGGVDILGNIVEASKLSINKKLYGDMHNMGHVASAICHDPDGRFLESHCVMGDVATAMRDPYFYRWHGLVDWIFRKYQDTHPEYTQKELAFDGVVVNSISVVIVRETTKYEPNKLLTFWQKSQVDLNKGLDFGQGVILASFTHLSHAPFNYEINVTNSGAARQGTCRIYIAPKTDERNIPLPYNQQRIYTIEMDKFTVNLTQGENKIIRRSDQSSVTIPYNRAFLQISGMATPSLADKSKRAEFSICGCGWPQHMLLPKGTPEEMQFDIFVMISNFEDDKVDGVFDDSIACQDAVSFCGLRDKKFPDKRTMGYPFDRKSASPTLAHFASKNRNMKTNSFTIKFIDTIVDKF